MLSIDIGLKNLGYAVFKYPEPGNESGTLSFDILNVDKQIDKSKPLTVAHIMIYDPKRKFITLCLNYDTHNKHHKALSVKIIGNYLAKEYPDLVDRFNSFKKKDDISDAMLMLFTVLYRAEKNKLKMIQQCGM